MERGIRALTGEEEERTAIQGRGRAAGVENDMTAGQPCISSETRNDTSFSRHSHRVGTGAADSGTQPELWFSQLSTTEGRWAVQ